MSFQFSEYNARKPDQVYTQIFFFCFKLNNSISLYKSYQSQSNNYTNQNTFQLVFSILKLYLQF